MLEAFVIIVALGGLELILWYLDHRQQKKQIELLDSIWAELVMTGVVEDVQVFQCPLSAGGGTHLALRTESGLLIVHVAPTAFLTNHEFMVADGDRVKIVGSKVRDRGADALIAREITRRNQTFIFRRPDGKPLWEE